MTRSTHPAIVLLALVGRSAAVAPTPHPPHLDHSPSPYPEHAPAPYHPAPVHPAPHHPAPVHPAPAHHPYTPSPHYAPPQYGPPQYPPTPAPYAPAPHAGAHHMPPHNYGYSPAPPAYGHQAHQPSYGYTPAPVPAYGHHAPTYAAPHHKPAPVHHKPHHEGPPACSKNTTKTWCLEDADYPAYEISQAIEYNYAGVATLYKDVLANTENSVDRLVELPQETYLCPSSTNYLMPLRAINTEGKWRIIVNGVKAHYETLTQTARVEECNGAGQACPLVPECYDTKCIQKSIYHRFLIYDEYDHYFPFAMESFKLPSSCACYNGAYAEAH